MTRSASDAGNTAGWSRRLAGASRHTFVRSYSPLIRDRATASGSWWERMFQSMSRSV